MSGESKSKVVLPYPWPPPHGMSDDQTMNIAANLSALMNYASDLIDRLEVAVMAAERLQAGHNEGTRPPDCPSSGG